MKKFLFVFAAMAAIFGAGKLFALTGDSVTTPASKAGQNTIQSADYGGVQITTFNLTSGANLAFSGEGLVYGVVFSTGNNTDFITFRDTSIANTSSNELFRLYNTNIASTTTNGVATFFGGPQTLRYPVRFKTGCSINANVATYNTMGVLYYQR